MIEIKNLSLEFDNTNFFEDVNIQFPKNKITVIAGPNGAGKTTLLKIMAGITKPKNANISINTSGIFYLPQKINYPSGITLNEYISSIFFKQTWKWCLSKEEKNKIDLVLKELEIYTKKNVLIDNLSSGELQKANIALGLISGAELLLLDEPTSNMDLINQIKILDMIKKLTTKNITSIIILHDLNLSSSYGDYFIGINNKQEFICSTKNEFFTCDVLEKIFNIQFKIINNDESIHVQIFN